MSSIHNQLDSNNTSNESTTIRASQVQLPDAAMTAEINDWQTGLSIEPRPYQRRIVETALHMFMGRHVDRFGVPQQTPHGVMVESPTGSGKTVMGLSIARHLQRKLGYRIGWVAMRRNLLAQAATENERRNFGVDLQLISMFDKNPPDVDFLVVDEAQHDAAESMANLHCRIQPIQTLGLSATPYRTDRAQLCFEKVIRDAGIHQLVQDGYLSKYHHYTIPEYTPAHVATHIIRDRDRWGKTLVFFLRHDECLECQDALSNAGIRCDVVTGKSRRDEQLQRFADGELDVLINMAVLTEGFDCPELKTVFCRPSSKGCTIQMAGRAFRRYPDLPFKQVIQCRRTKHPMTKTVTAEQQFVWVGNSWRGLQLNDQIEQLCEQTRAKLAHAKVELPQYVRRRRKTRAAEPVLRDRPYSMRRGPRK